MYGSIVLFLFAANTYAGPQSAISGRVIDPSGAAVPNARIEVRCGSLTAAAVSRIQGEYRVQAREGACTLTVRHDGFRDFSRDVAVDASGARIEIVLELAAVSQQVTITTKAPPLESEPERRVGNFQEILEVREVRESAARDVGEALAQLEGVWKVRKGGIANDLVLRGFQQDNVALLVDGARIHGACPNNMDPPAFHADFAEIRQVEVIKGPYEMSSQGALGGAVRLIGKDPEAGLRVRPSFAAGSFGYFNPSMTASFSNSRFSMLTGYSFRRSDPYRDGSGQRFTSRTNYQRRSLSDAFSIQTGWLKTGLSLGGTRRLSWAYTRQAAGDTLYPYLTMDAVYDHADRATFAYQVGEAGSRRVRVESYFTRVKHWMTDEQRTSAIGMPLGFSMATFAATKSLGGRAEVDARGFSSGIEAYRRNWNATNLMRMSNHSIDQPALPNVDLSVAGLYSQYHGTLGRRLRVGAGTRFDAARSEARSPALSTDLYWAYKNTRDRAATDLSPSGSAWLAYSLPANLELFAGSGSAARVPDPRERFIALRRMGTDWVGNPKLRPVRNNEADVGLQYRGRRVSVRPTLFYSRIEDFIVVHNQQRINPVGFTMNSLARSYDNVAATIYGGEVTYSAGFGKAVLLAGGASWARGVKDPRPELGIRGRDLSEMPPLKARTSLRYGNRKFFGEAEILAASRQRRVDVDLGESPTAGYAVFNVKSGLHLRRLNFTAGVDNLADRLFYEHFSFQRDPFRSGVRVPEPGRSLYLNLSYAF